MLKYYLFVTEVKRNNERVRESVKNKNERERLRDNTPAIIFCIRMLKEKPVD
jgi:hypothetical protein